MRPAGMAAPKGRIRGGFVGLLLTVLTCLAAAQDQQEMIQPRKLIDAHTAGVLPKATYDFECRIFPSGEKDIWGDRNSWGAGLLLALSVGITNRLNIGISYGGDGLVGHGRMIRPNPYPGALIKYRLFEESYTLPALAIGYEHQGYGGIEGGWDKSDGGDYMGFVYKSKGFFVVLSKNFLFFSRVQLGLHGGVNFSFEEFSNVKWPSGYVGLDLGVNDELALAIEYDLALNSHDPGTSIYGNPLRGLLNAGLRWALTPEFYLEFNCKDVLENRARWDSNAGIYRPIGWTRELKIVYVKQFGAD